MMWLYFLLLPLSLNFCFLILTVLCSPSPFLFLLTYFHWNHPFISLLIFVHIISNQFESLFYSFISFILVISFFLPFFSVVSFLRLSFYSWNVFNTYCVRRKMSTYVFHFSPVHFILDLKYPARLIIIIIIYFPLVSEILNPLLFSSSGRSKAKDRRR